jgi:hypothetical protein
LVDTLSDVETILPEAACLCHRIPNLPFEQLDLCSGSLLNSGHLFAVLSNSYPISLILKAPIKCLPGDMLVAQLALLQLSRATILVRSLSRKLPCPTSSSHAGSVRNIQLYGNQLALYSI